VLIDFQVLIRTTHFASVAVLAGLLCFVFLVAEPTFKGAEPRCQAAIVRLRRFFIAVGWSALLVAMLSGSSWLLVLATRLAGGSLASAIAEAIPLTILTETQFGADWLVRLLLAALSAILLGRFRPESGWQSRAEGGLAVLLSAALMGSLAWAGHGGAGDLLEITGDAIHLVAAGSWVGGLVPFTILVGYAARGRELAFRAIATTATVRFSLLGLISVIALLATGLLNTWFLVGTLPGLIGTSYGGLLLLKISLFLAMLALAAINRLRLLPRIVSLRHHSEEVLWQLRRNGLLETVLGLAIFWIVAALGAMPPAAHTQPLWPIPFRLSLGALNDPAHRLELVIALTAAALGTVLLLSGAFWTRLRFPLVAGGGLLVVAFVPRLSPIVVAAFPTSYYVSPTGFSAQSIAAGEQFFANACVPCHGSDGRGDGPLAKGLEPPPADLIAHGYDHPEGDLYWWITNGIGKAMPAFGAVLDETARWNLIDFLRANADATRLSKPDALAPVPNFFVTCADGSSVAMSALRPNIVHLVVTSPASQTRLHQLAAGATIGDVRTVVVRLAAGPEEDEAPFCGTDDPEVSKTLALYRHVPVAQLAGTEFLVDGAGLFRALWYSGIQPGWEDPKTLASAIANLRRQAPLKPAPLPRAEHRH
jgi:copper resistance protein D